MATTTDDEASGCTFQWKIENVLHWCWLKKGEGIESPVFIADALEKTKWTLRFYPMEEGNESYVGIYLRREKDCSGPDTFEVNFQIAFLGQDGSILKESSLQNRKFLKNDCLGFPKFERRGRVFGTEKEAFIPDETLTVQCTIYTINTKPSKSNHTYATTVIKVKRRSFVWRIDKISTLKSGKRYKFKDYLIRFDVVSNNDFDRLYLDMTAFDDIIKSISCKTSIIDSERRKENCEIKKYFASDLKKGVLSSTLFFPKTVMENKSRYFPNDVLSLDFELVISTVEHFGCTENKAKLENEVGGKEMSQNTSVLIDDFKSLYKDGIFSDTELRTSTKTFPAHKNILSARSPVFRNMFSSDMKEKKSGYVDITDFEDDTVHRMLLYIYTDSLDNMQYESAWKLYTISDKYQIPSLKSRCSSFLEENLCPTNACKVLVLAVLHNDDDLKSSVEDYILGESKQIFCSQEWKDFMSTHLKLAADIMHRKITKSKMHLK